MYLYSGWPDSLVVLTAATLSLVLYLGLRDGGLLCFFIGHMPFRSFPVFYCYPYSYLYSYFYPYLLLSGAQSKLLLLVPLLFWRRISSGTGFILWRHPQDPEGRASRIVLAQAFPWPSG